MIMVQLITITLTLLAILVFRGDDINSSNMAWMVGGLFGSFLLASAIYSRITSI
jgi:succinate-acetate transporter protein